ncbi:MFS transporter [Streptomyces sp. CB02400]|uniref:MFS transporter n=1 Tax=Streptomyces sp. CB02400 TaxID=1703944 RepID=UPI00093F4D08|nr:MFS transporter [Streptomyces sp. CB02400]OKK13421.1 MFS transporter [Streptomyces sp. CB02400]
MTGTAAPGRTAGIAPGASVTAVVGLLVLFEAMSGITQMGITPLLPELAAAYGLDGSAANWIGAVQLLAATVCVPLFGRLGDLYGHRRMLRVALVCVAAGSLLVALAPTPALLWTGRALQGPLAALLPLEIALVRDRLSVPDARRAIARLVGALTVGGLLGAALMGAAADALGDVRTALLIPAGLAAVCVPLSFVAVPESAAAGGERMDWAGFALLALGASTLLAGVFALERGGGAGPLVAGPLLLGSALLAVWVRVELRRPDPLVDVRSLADRRAGPFYLAAAGFGVVYFAAQAPETTFLAADPHETGYGFGMSSAQISLVLLPAIVAAVVGSAVTVPLARRIGYRSALACAFGLVAVSFLALAARHGAVGEIVAAKVVTGLGLGIALSAMPTVIVEAADRSRSGVATALYNNVKTFGGAVAGGLMAAVLATSSHNTPTSNAAPEEGAYVAVWLLCAGCAAAGAGAALLARRTEGADSGVSR